MPMLLFNVYPIAAIPSPPIAGRIFFESPIVAPVAVAAAGLLVAGILLRKGKSKPAMIAFAIGIALAAGLAISSEVVTTPREQVEARTLELVDAVAAGDTGAVEDLIANRFVLRVNGDDAIMTDPKGFVVGEIENVKNLIDDYSRRSVASIADSPISGRVRFSVRAGLRGGGLNYTVWQCEWRRDPDQIWRLFSLDLKKVNGQEAYRRNFFGARPRG